MSIDKAPRKQENSNETAGNALKKIPEQGSRVLLIKQSIASGESSGIQQGEGLQGILVSSIQIGQPILLMDGGRTSRVQSVEPLQDKIRITTETSVYELYTLFSGLKIDSAIGRVSLPDDARPPKLEPGSAPGIKGRAGEKIVQVKIDRNELNNVLIKVGNGVVHVVGSRYIVLTRIGKAHVPFYRSSSGTDGKNQGEWYPFFGHTGDWLIKGDIAKDGSMNYSPEITEVQKLLNEHLILPDTSFLNREFNMTSVKDGSILYSLGKDIPMDNFIDSEQFKNRGDNYDEAERLYVKSLTGYDPVQLKGHHPGYKDGKSQMVWDWISEVTQGVHKAQS
ncbi:hypothetical protein BH11PAT2_BH11PAT2_02830 [soil metagenome]